MSRTQIARRGLVGVVLVAVFALSGCVSMPNSGPVIDVDRGEGANQIDVSDIDAQPPIAGANPAEIVTGFYEAMTAWPIQTNVAKEYLTRNAARTWQPQARTIVYSGDVTPEESFNRVDVRLSRADQLDSSGSWAGELTEAERTFTYEMVLEDGEYRIANPANGLVVPSEWFMQRFSQVSLYFFDPVAETLVPEPVFLPVGEQLATSLVSALVSGPPDRQRDVVQTFLPKGLSVGLSVPISERGVIEIDLVGDANMPAPEEVDLLYGQLAWTLRQVPNVTAFTVSIDGEELTPPSGSIPFDVQAGTRFDPAGVGTSSLLYGIRRGRLVQAEFADFEPTSGPFGETKRRLRSVAVSPDGRYAAGVVAGGRRLQIGDVDQTVGGGRVRTPITRAADLAEPTWDAAGRLWVIDRTRRGARVISVVDEVVRQVSVPGISGTSVRRIVVSRDGTRLVGVGSGSAGDRVVSARVVLGRDGAVRRAIGPAVVRPADGARIADLAWSGESELSVLKPAGSSGLFEIDTISATGGPAVDTQASTTVPGDFLGVAGSPSDEQVIAVSVTEIVDVQNRDAETLDAPIRDIDFVG